MSTIKRLQRLTGEYPKAQNDSPQADVISELRRRVDAVMSRHSRIPSKSPQPFTDTAPKIESLINGEEIENDSGKFYLVQDRIPGTYRHGHRHLRAVCDIDMKALSLLANHADITHFNYTDALFLDTETTGLSGGTGTLPFLIGLGWFEGDSFMIRQIFIRDFKEERASLSFLLNLAREKRFLVTFNGKAFDIGLLSTRLIMNRLHDSLSSIPHLDLLHPSRRLLGHRTENNRLSTLEASILGFRREGDVPGSEIPQRYFDWLRYRDPRLLADVFEHNRLDVISMVALTVHLAEILKADSDADFIEESDLIAASRLLADRDDFPGAQSILEMLVESPDRQSVKESRKLLSLLYKRSGSYDKSTKIWEMMIADDPFDVFAAEELAKWYEHRQYDFKKAYCLIENVLLHSHNMTDSEKDSFNHRLMRLRGRCER
jgi:uncharacterized protein